MKASKVWTVMLALSLMLLACSKKEIREPDPITVVVTIDYGDAGKMIKFVYQGQPVWQSKPNVSDVDYYQIGETVYLSFLQEGRKVEISFVNGKLVGV